MTPEEQRARAQLMVWWTIWFGLISGLCVIYFILGRGQPLATAPNPPANLIGLVPLFLSIVIRWLVLPRYTDRQRAFVMFIVGLALAEGCGLLGIFLGGLYRDDLFLLGVLGLAQFVPFFAGKFRNPPPTGFIPDN